MYYIISVIRNHKGVLQMTNKLNTVIKVFESLVKMNNWEVERFDIQAYDYGKGICGYVGYATIKGFNRVLVVRGDGSFDWK